MTSRLPGKGLAAGSGISVWFGEDLEDSRLLGPKVGTEVALSSVRENCE